MKPIDLIAGVLSVATLVGCNGQGQRDDGLPRLPRFLEHKVLGANYHVDTLYQSSGNAYCVLQNSEYGQRMLYDDEKVYASNPLMTIDSLSETSCRISMLSRSVIVDFAKPSTLQQIDTVVPSYPEFETCSHGYSISEPLRAVYGYNVEVPKRDMPDRKPLERWLASILTDSVQSGKTDFDKIGEINSKRYFESISQDGYEAPEQWADLFSVDSYSVYYYSPARYVTYLDYNYSYMGGAHGMYCIRLATYSFEKKDGITLDNMFKPDSRPAILDLIRQSISQDSVFAPCYDEAAMRVGDMPLPQPALLPEGVVFCYQPYEISLYSDVAYQFMVPWPAIAPYLK